MIKAAQIRRSEAIEQLMRFERYTGFPSDVSHDLEELIQAFQLAASTAGTAKLIGDRLMRTQRRGFAPRPADVWEAAAEVDAELAQPAEYDSTVRCLVCQDTGFTVNGRDEERFARPCVCRKASNDPA